MRLRGPPLAANAGGFDHVAVVGDGERGERVLLDPAQAAALEALHEQLAAGIVGASNQHAAKALLQFISSPASIATIRQRI
jgi:hypothetical protein